MPAAAAVVAIVAAAAASTYQAIETRREAKAAEGQAKKQARIAEENAKTEAERIRERGQRLLGSQKSALAGAGVKIDEGTGDALQQETLQLTERDALLAIKEGKQEADYFRDMAKRYRKKAQSAVIAGNLGVGQTVAGGVSQVQAANRPNTQANNINTSLGQDGAAQTLARRSSSQYSLLSGTGSERIGRYSSP